MEWKKYDLVFAQSNGLFSIKSAEGLDCPSKNQFSFLASFIDS
jgi:hypothetical protein